MTGERARKQMQAAADAVNRGDMDGLRACFAPGYRLADLRPLGWDTADAAEATENARGFMTMSDDYRWEIQWLDGDDELFVIRHIATGTVRDTGGAFRYEVLHVTRACADGFLVS